MTSDISIKNLIGLLGVVIGFSCYRFFRCLVKFLVVVVSVGSYLLFLNIKRDGDILILIYVFYCR